MFLACIVSNSLAVPAPVRTLLSSGRIIFGGGYENCPEFGIV